MSQIKQHAIQIIESLPEQTTIEDIMEELFFKLQIDEGLKELDEGKGVPQEEVEQRLSKWLE